MARGQPGRERDLHPATIHDGRFGILLGAVLPMAGDVLAGETPHFLDVSVHGLDENGWALDEPAIRFANPQRFEPVPAARPGLTVASDVTTQGAVATGGELHAWTTTAAETLAIQGTTAVEAGPIAVTSTLTSNSLVTKGDLTATKDLVGR
jgi:hypothetical protein